MIAGRARTAASGWSSGISRGAAAQRKRYFAGDSQDPPGMTFDPTNRPHQPGLLDAAANP